MPDGTAALTSLGVYSKRWLAGVVHRCSAYLAVQHSSAKIHLGLRRPCSYPLLEDLGDVSLDVFPIQSLGYLRSSGFGIVSLGVAIY